jgi:glutamate formiminotransferase
VEEEAAALGTRVIETEIVGLVPAAAVHGVAWEALKLPGPAAILEDRLTP